MRISLKHKLITINIFLLLSIVLSQIASPITKAPTTRAPTTKAPTTSAPTPIPTLITSSPTKSTSNPSVTPTKSPSVNPTQPTSSPTSAPSMQPTPIPTIIENYCNVHNGADIKNNIELIQNSRISNYMITDPLLIAFDFIIDDDSTKKCTSTDSSINITCNLIQFGMNGDFLFPKVSLKNTEGFLTWDIRLNATGTLEEIKQNENTPDPTQDPTLRPTPNPTAPTPAPISPIPVCQSVPQTVCIPGFGCTTVWILECTTNSMPYVAPPTPIPTYEPSVATLPTINLNTPSSFHITFTGTQRAIYIDNDLWHYSNHTNNIFTSIVNESVPFYTSNPDEVGLSGNITNLCVASDSQSPTPSPTNLPTTSTSTSIPSSNPTPHPTEQLYEKIDCYTEIGDVGALELQCSDSNYFVTSCGVLSNSSSYNIPIFNKGLYIEREFINRIDTTDGICHIDYNININNISNITTTYAIRPKARCCNFRQAYGDTFRCRYFESSSISSNYDSTESAASIYNEFSFVTCSDEFPLLLSCSTKVKETTTTSITSSSTDDIQFYGSFYSPSSAPRDDYNPEYNKFFSLIFNESIPNPPTTPPNSTILTPTAAPTIPPTISTDTVNLGISPTTRCVAQYGPNTGNYEITAVATCCSENVDYSSSISIAAEPTFAPTLAPTYPILLKIPAEPLYFGIGQEANQIDDFTQPGDEGAITGISDWGIAQVRDEESINKIISYQGIYIGEYQRSDGQTVNTDSDFTAFLSGKFYSIYDCAAFTLDSDNNGNRDYINGFDVYYTEIAIYGIRFYTSFGREFPCPDNEIFNDTSISDVNSTLNGTYYTMTKETSLNAFGLNGTYKLGGFEGKKQTRELQTGVSRSVMSIIRFIFLGNSSISPSPSPIIVSRNISTSNITLLPGQQPLGSYSLNCYTIWGKEKVECNDTTTDTMTGCTGYAVSGQIFNSCIKENNTGFPDQCIVNTINNNKDVVAIATCCRFIIVPPRDFSIFVYVSIVGGSLLGATAIAIILYLTLWVRVKVYFLESDLDDDTKIDTALENIGTEVASEKVKRFGINERTHNEMIELQQRQSDSVGLADQDTDADEEISNEIREWLEEKKKNNEEITTNMEIWKPEDEK